jgi:hypothetical protein
LPLPVFEGPLEYRESLVSGSVARYNMIHAFSSPRYIRQYTWLICASMFAGALSGCFYPTTMAVRGAILGLFMALGLISINQFGQHRLTYSVPPLNGMVFIAALVNGLIGGLMITLYDTGGVIARGEFAPTVTPLGLPAIVVSIAYSVTMQLAYTVRWHVEEGQRVTSIVLIGVAGYVCGTLRPLLGPEAEFWSAGHLLKFGLMSGLPFGVFWAIAAIAFDPAWTYKRWRNIRKDR